MSWGSGIKRDSLDADFSRAVRERAEWSCERCHRYFPVGERAGLQCSHYFSRRNKSLRYHPLNGFSLCSACHRRLTENPDDHREWVADRLGPQKFIALRTLRIGVVPMSPPIKKFIAGKLKAIVAEQERLRAMGVDGRLDFGSPYPGFNDELPSIKRKPRKAKAKAPKRAWPKRPFPKQHRPLRRKVAA